MMEKSQRRLAAILMADVVGYSRLIGEFEESTLVALQKHRRELINDLIELYGGRVANTAGDSLLLEFSSVVDAAKCAITIQEGMVDRNRDVADDQKIRFRIGINVGEVITIDGDIFGDAVNIAARLEGISEPDGVLLSDNAYGHIGNRIDNSFQNIGAKNLKNIVEPVVVWRWRAGQVSLSSPSQPDKSKVQQREKPSLVILPFECMSDVTEHEYLADGLNEDITTLLARIPDFFVIARNSAFSFKSTLTDIREIGRQLNVRYAVEGSLRPIGKKFRVSVQLIDTENGQHIWAKRLDHPADAIDQLQDQITSAIVTHLLPELTRVEFARIERRPLKDYDAWTYHQKASGLLALKGWRKETFIEAAALYRKSIALDPQLASAHAALSLLLALGHVVGYFSDPAAALSAAEEAMKLDSNNSEVLGFAGCALSDLGYTSRGIEVLEQALELNPSNAQAMVALGSSYFLSRDIENAVDYMRRGLELSPCDNRLAIWRGVFALALSHSGELEAGIEQAKLGCRHDRNMPIPRVVLASLLLLAGRKDDALSALKEARRIHPDLTHREIAGLVGRKSASMLAAIWQ